MMSRDLLLAILAMDVYHRGYNAGLERDTTESRSRVEGSQVGLWELGSDSLVLGQQGDSRLDESIGFYAQAYTLGSETIIAYRGTDNGINNLTPTAKDQIYGYGLSIGNGTADQALMAIDFYRRARRAA